jgi:hypothetical protein
MRGLMAMRDHDRAMLMYVHLARLSQQKGQLPGRNKFLVLAGAEACPAGWLDVAARCRELVLADNPSHVLSKTATFPDALRGDDLPPLLKQLERFCTIERAEHLLAELEIEVGPPRVDSNEPPSQTPGEYALQLLR